MSEMHTANQVSVADPHPAPPATTAVPGWLQTIVLLGALLMALALSSRY
jgi:hypothetical protein